MPILEVRRHSVRKSGGGSQLSQAGVDLARAHGAQMGPFAKVVTSVLPRARETALAMGYAVDEELVTLNTINDGAYEEVGEFDWAAAVTPFCGAAELIAQQGAYWRYANALAGMWRDIMTPLGMSDRALFIGHSGELEAALVACCPHGAHATWGGMFGPLEGAQLEFSGEPARFGDVRIIRVAHS